MGLEEILREFIEWNNENYNEGYIPNSRLGRYLMEKQCEGKETPDELSNCIKPDVSNCALPTLTEFATKALDNIADACKYITSGNASHQSKSIEGSAKRNAEFIRKHYC